MNNIRLNLKVIPAGLLLALLVLSMSSTTFGELGAQTLVHSNTEQAELSHQQNERSKRALPSESMGFRSAESESESTFVPLAPLQRSLSVKEPELVETTDVSGGTMIQLQGKFQCGLKVQSKQMDRIIDPMLSPTMP